AMAATALAARPVSSRRTPVSSKPVLPAAAWPATSLGAFIVSACAAASLEDADFLVVLRRARMQRDGHAGERVGELDRLGGRVRGHQLVEVGPQRLRHLIDGVVADAIVGDEEILHCGGLHILVL